VLDEVNGARYPTGWGPKAAFDALAELYESRVATGAQRR
jgi:hypothetical protein